jgi:hypothetical protein
MRPVSFQNGRILRFWRKRRPDSAPLADSDFSLVCFFYNMLILNKKWHIAVVPGELLKVDRAENDLTMLNLFSNCIDIFT